MSREAPCTCLSAGCWHSPRAVLDAVHLAMSLLSRMSPNALAHLPEQLNGT